ncbi:MAG: LysM peptidoglycan-binding domain-containing protein [Flavipsychrobacter sp.]|nr:LysM peptidoglycan-binding domain-containing protein [Flavipsychrobacter sp.]
MLRLVSFLLGVLFATVATAQSEKYFVRYKNGQLVIEHTIAPGETVYGLARRFHVPPAQLTDLNHVGYQAKLTPGTTIDIPLAVYNHINEAPEYMNDVRELYYRVENKENLPRVVRYTGVPQRKIEKWNNLTGSYLRDGQELMVGWVLYDATPIASQVKQPDAVARTTGDWSTRTANQPQEETPSRTLDDLRPDTVSVPVTRVVADTAHVVTPEEETYMAQTLQEQRIITEKGPAAFFTPKTASKSYYAFHNTLPRGTILKVLNPGSGKWIFAKVIGTVPATAQYYNCLIGLTATAKRELGVRENKMFCEISYGVL